MNEHMKPGFSLPENQITINKNGTYLVSNTQEQFEVGDLVCIDNTGNYVKHRKPSFFEYWLNQLNIVKLQEQFPIGVAVSTVSGE